MAKCRECDGKGSEYNPAGGIAGNNMTCSSCAGTGEVSQSPEHMVSQPNLHPMVHSDTISLLRAAEEQLRMAEEESCNDLADEIAAHLKKLGVE